MKRVLKAMTRHARRRAVLLVHALGFLLLAAAQAASTQTASVAQSPTAAQSVPAAEAAPAGGPIAIVPIENGSPDAAATVTGALEVTGGKAIIAASGSVTSGSRTAEVVLPHRGVLRVCASTTVKLAADTSVPAGETPGLLMAMDHGAVEMSFANLGNADILLTPNFKILIGGPGAAEVKVRLGSEGDTCVDNTEAPSDRFSPPGSNSGANAPYVVVSSVFDSGLYRVQPGQRVMFLHGSLHEVVDQEKEPCGCPPPAEARSNEFPLAQSEGLAPGPASAPVPATATKHAAAAGPGAEALVYNGAERAPQMAAIPQPAATPTAVAPASPPATAPATRKKTGFFGRIGHFFRRIFGGQ